MYTDTHTKNLTPTHTYTQNIHTKHTHKPTHIYTQTVQAVETNGLSSKVTVVHADVESSAFQLVRVA